MTLADSITPAVAVQPRQPVSLVVVEPDLRANIETAAATGNMAYERTQDAGGTPEACADAYHFTFAAVMLELGTPVPCACDYCAALRVH